MKKSPDKGESEEVDNPPIAGGESPTAAAINGVPLDVEAPPASVIYERFGNGEGFGE